MRIRWTEPAALDLTHICDHIEKQSGPAVARRVALSIHEHITFPYAVPAVGSTWPQTNHARIGLF